jgi:hypothetical protein
MKSYSDYTSCEWLTETWQAFDTLSLPLVPTQWIMPRALSPFIRSPNYTSNNVCFEMLSDIAATNCNFSLPSPPPTPTFLNVSIMRCVKINEAVPFRPYFTFLKVFRAAGWLPCARLSSSTAAPRCQQVTTRRSDVFYTQTVRPPASCSLRRVQSVSSLPSGYWSPPSALHPSPSLSHTQHPAPVSSSIFPRYRSDMCKSMCPEDWNDTHCPSLLLI